MRRLINQTGDTIVEVLVATAVISFVIGTSFSLVSRNLKVTRGAQEHTEALKLAENQLEYLRVASADTTAPTIFTYQNYFCMTGTDSAHIKVATSVMNTVA